MNKEEWYMVYHGKKIDFDVRRVLTKHACMAPLNYCLHDWVLH